MFDKNGFEICVKKFSTHYKLKLQNKKDNRFHSFSSDDSKDYIEYKDETIIYWKVLIENKKKINKIIIKNINSKDKEKVTLENIKLIFTNRLWKLKKIWIIFNRTNQI